MKGLTMSRIKGKYASTNNGISDKYDAFFVIGFDWLEQDSLEENTENLPLLVIKRRAGNYLHGKLYYWAEPVDKPEELGWMNGGNMLDMCIDEQEIVYIHDRQETQELYDYLSR